MKTIIENLIEEAIVAWIAMLLLGAAHSNSPAVPALGYWATLCLTLVTVAVAHLGARGAIAEVSR